MKSEDPPQAFKCSIMKVNKLPAMKHRQFVNCLWFQLYPAVLKTIIQKTESIQSYQIFFDKTFYQLVQSSGLEISQYSLSQDLNRKSFEFFKTNMLEEFSFYHQSINKILSQKGVYSSKTLSQQFCRWVWSHLSEEQNQNWVRAAFEGIQVNLPSRKAYLKLFASFCEEQHDDSSSHIHQPQIKQQKIKFSGEFINNQDLNQKLLVQDEELLLNSHEMIDEDAVIQAERTEQDYIEINELSPLIVTKRYIPDCKRASKNGYIKVFGCNHCQKEYPINKRRALIHKTKCSKRLLIKNYFAKENRVQKDSQGQQGLIEIEEDPRELRIEGLQSKIDHLNAKINILLEKPGQTFMQRQKEAQFLSEKIWNETVEILSPLMISQLKEQVLQEMNNSRLPFEVLTRTMKFNLKSRLMEIDLKELLISWNHKLTDACDQLLYLNSKHGCRPETRSRDNTASKYLQKFSEYELTCNHRKLLQLLSLESKYKRTNIVRFYNKLLRKFPTLKLKNLPLSLSIYNFTFQQRRILTISDIKNVVVRLWNEKNFTLATDIWSVVCLGFRKTEQLRVFFLDKQGTGFKLIKVFENKNKNITSRFLPCSLLQLCKLSGVPFPITQHRFAEMRTYCLNQLGQFYGLRHVCLTNIVISLLNASQLNIHKQPTTTLGRYIDINNYDLISKSFDLPEFDKHFQNVSITFSEKYPSISQDGSVEFLNIQQKVKLQLIEESQEEYLKDASIDAGLSHRLERGYLNCDEIDEDDKIEMLQRQQIFKNHCQELIEQSFGSYSIAINFLLDHSSLQHSDLRMAELDQEKPITTGSRLSLISKILNLEIFDYKFSHGDEPSLTKRTEFLHKENRSQSPSIVLSQTSGKVKIGDSVLELNSYQSSYQASEVRTDGHSRNLRKKATVSSETSYLMTPGTPFCSTCFKFLQVFQRKGNYHLKCNYCKSSFESLFISRTEILKSSEIKMIPLLQKHSSRVNTSLKACDKSNNLKKSVEEHFGQGSYSTEMFYSIQFPREFNIEMTFHSLKTQEAIIYNRRNQQTLPLEIKESLIPQAGLGLFATTTIPEDSLIITYTGVLRTHTSIDPSNNSLFIMGSMSSWKQREKPLEIILEPRIKLNPGRFINTGSSGYQNNSSSLLGLMVNPNTKATEIALYIYALRSIKPSEEILYEYGDSYNLIATENID